MDTNSQRLEKLRDIVLQCRQCSLFESRTKMVFGDGDPNASVMFVGEGPGRSEDFSGKPFVGTSGQLLRKMISAIGIPPEDHYIANILKDRPPNNRKPEPEEIQACRRFLEKQIEIIHPRVIVLLGRTAVEGVIPEYATHGLDTLRKKTKKLGSVCYKDIPAVVTYHPSALLRSPEHRPKAKEDFEFLQAVYAGAITPEQELEKEVLPF